MTGGHGGVGSLSKLDRGIEIWMRRLNTIDIAKNGKTVRLGGGLLVKEVTDALWAKGKQTSRTPLTFIPNKVVSVLMPAQPLVYVNVLAWWVPCWEADMVFFRVAMVLWRTT